MGLQHRSHQYEFVLWFRRHQHKQRGGQRCRAREGADLQGRVWQVGQEDLLLVPRNQAEAVRRAVPRWRGRVAFYARASLGPTRQTYTDAGLLLNRAGQRARLTRGIGAWQRPAHSEPQSPHTRGLRPTAIAGSHCVIHSGCHAGFFKHRHNSPCPVPPSAHSALRTHTPCDGGVHLRACLRVSKQGSTLLLLAGSVQTEMY